MASVKNFHIGIKAVIVNMGRVLVLKDPKRYQGYDLPGGKIDQGETIEEALKRELEEELGLKKFKLGDLLHAFERTDYEKGDIRLMLIFYKVEAKISNIRLSNEHTSFAWISKKDLNEVIAKGEIRNEGVKLALEKALK